MWSRPPNRFTDPVIPLDAMDTAPVTVNLRVNLFGCQRTLLARNMTQYVVRYEAIFEMQITQNNKVKVNCPCALTEHHAMKAY